MKILHITTIDIGGAYKAVSRLNKALLQENIESNILLRTKQKKEEELEYIFLDNGMKRIISKAKNVLNKFFSKGEIIRDLFGSDVSEHELVKAADIIALHWTNSFLSYKSVEQLLQLNKPIIWFMHDMWLFTGGCPCSFDCKNYEKGCGTCPLIPSNKEQDVSRKNYLDKIKVLKESKIQVAAPSKWLQECAKASLLFENREIQYISNCYDDTIFFRRNNSEIEECYKKYNIPKGVPIILYGAVKNGAENKIKGYSYFKEVINLMKDETYCIIMVGGSTKDVEVENNSKIIEVGYIEEEKELAAIYSLADVYLTTSLQESFGYTVCEALACGTPVVGFGLGGLLDQIVHKENGYLAKLYSSEDLVKGMKFCIEHKKKMCDSAQKLAQRFSMKTMSKQYKEVLKAVKYDR